MDFIIYFIVYTVEMLLGAFWVREAVNDFKRQRYYLFGIDMMTVAFCVCMLAKLCFDI